MNRVMFMFLFIISLIFNGMPQAVMMCYIVCSCLKAAVHF